MRGIHKVMISHFGIVLVRICALENRGFEFIDTEELDALDPTDEQDAERIEALHKAHLIQHPADCGAARPRVQGISLGLASSPYRQVRFRCARSRNATATGPVGPSRRHVGE